jgi:hypothetical protein
MVLPLFITRGPSLLDFFADSFRYQISCLSNNYFGRKFTDEAKKNTLLPIVAKKNDAKGLDAIPISQDVYVYATILDNDAKVTHTVKEKRRLYIHVVQNGGTIKVKAINGDEVLLKEGDGAFIEGATAVELTGATAVTKAKSEVLLFDLV